MMHGMGGGIGATMIMGWPLADWATIMLLLIVSIMVVAFLSAVLSFLTPRPEQRHGRTDQKETTPPRPEAPSK